MKISYNWLKQHLSAVPQIDAMDNLLTQVGLEVEGVTYTGMNPEKLLGLIVGEVIECTPHPNADKLKLTKVNIGGSELLNIVCGAPNVALGQKVVVATIGTTLYPLTGESFKIKKSKIRGEESNGMLCAEDEIGLGGSHAGIIVLPADIKVGIAISEVLKFDNDALIEIGITPNHADACSHLGIARELRAAMMNSGEAVQLTYDTHALPDVKLDTIDNPISVHVSDDSLCPRYAGIYIQNIVVGPSPEWLQQKLKSIGLKPINNLVDISNYVLHDIGQPIHIFDADQIKENKIHVRLSNTGEKFTTLDGVERKLQGTELMICDFEHPMAIAGVFGGIDSGVSLATKNIFIESAYFNPATVRKSARAHALNTDASFRFERGTDPDLVLWALHFTAKLIQECAGGQASSNIIDHYPHPIQPSRIELRFSQLKQIIGKEISKEEIKNILGSLNIKIVNESETALNVEVPAYKNDVTTSIDLCEELLRIHGLNNVPLPGRISTSIILSNKSKLYSFRENLAQHLAHKGYNEIMTNSLTKASYPQVTKENRVELLNPLSSDMGVMRDTLLFTGLEVVAYNLNRNIHQLHLFELGRTYSHKNKSEPNPAGESFSKGGVSLYKEEEHCAIYITGKEEKLNALKPITAPSFYDVKTLVYELLSDFGLSNLNSISYEDDLLRSGLILTLNNKTIAHFGLVNTKILKQFDISQQVYFVDINLVNMSRMVETGFKKVKPVSKYLSVRRDLSLLIDEQIQFEQLELVARKSERKLLKDVGVFDIYKGDKLGEGKKSYALYFTLQDEENTLEDKDINQAMQRIQQALEKELGAVIR